MLFEVKEQSQKVRLAGFSNVEYAMASVYESQGYATIHHDYYLFHESKKTKFPKNESLLKSVIGPERLCELREVCLTLYPMDLGRGLRPEQPDLFVYHPNGDFFFSEVKRSKTGDALRPPHMEASAALRKYKFIKTKPLANTVGLVFSADTNALLARCFREQ